jgi:glycosyltransferase involved in cell wall biosynthesis
LTNHSPRIASVHAPTNEPAWQGVTVIDVIGSPVWVAVRSIVRAARRNDVLILNGAARFPWRYRDFIAALLIARMRRPPAIVFTEATWDWTIQPLERLRGRGGGALRALTRGTLRAFDGPHVVYCVLSDAERETFRARFGVPEDRVVVTPFPYTLFDALPTTDDGYVFAGGDSRRDYAPLLAAARGLDRRFVIATRLELDGVPSNVEARGTSPEEFAALQSAAGAVVVALDPRSRCSAGQQSFLNAMLQGKPTVVIDALGVREYVEHGVDGWVVPPHDPQALRARLEWIFDERNRDAVSEVTRRGPEVVLGRFSPEQYWWAVRRAAEAAARRASD